MKAFNDIKITLMIIFLTAIAIVSACEYSEKEDTRSSYEDIVYNDLKIVNTHNYDNYPPEVFRMDKEDNAINLLNHDWKKVFPNSEDFSSCKREILNNSIKFECGENYPEYFIVELRDYRDFTACKEVEEEVFDYYCDCKTDFKEGLTWVIVKPGTMTFDFFHDVNTGNLLCIIGSA